MPEEQITLPAHLLEDIMKQRTLVDFMSSMSIGINQFVDYLLEVDDHATTIALFMAHNSEPEKEHDFTANNFESDVVPERMIWPNDFANSTEISIRSPIATKKDCLLRFLFLMNISINKAIHYIKHSRLRTLLGTYWDFKNSPLGFEDFRERKKSRAQLLADKMRQKKGLEPSSPAHILRGGYVRAAAVSFALVHRPITKNPYDDDVPRLIRDSNKIYDQQGIFEKEPYKQFCF